MNIATLMLKKMCVVVVLCVWWGSASAFADTKTEKQITNSIGMKFGLIPAGKFTMGSPPDERLRFDNEKQVSVTLTRDFYLGTTEVTQFQWQSVMGTRPWSGKKFIKEGKDYPATYVSWKDAVAFCKKLTEVERRAGRLPAGWEYRLPTEAQWEYACRAGSTKAYGIDDGTSFRDYAWHDGTVKGEKYAHQVGQKSEPMRMVCTTCTETCGSGARTITLRHCLEALTRKVLPRGRSASAAAVVGSTPTGRAGRRAANGTCPARGSTLSVFACPEFRPASKASQGRRAGDTHLAGTHPGPLEPEPWTHCS